MFRAAAFGALLLSSGCVSTHAPTLYAVAAPDEASIAQTASAPQKPAKPRKASMLRGAVAAPPLSFQRTCTVAPGECELPNLDYVASLTDKQALRMLQRVNTTVNARMARLATWQMNPRDEWLPARATAVGLSGDCKSFAAEKRRQLIAEGFPADQLSYVVVFRPDLGLHALLMARLNGGDYVLDSREPWVTPWGEAGYTFVLFQQPGRPAEWRTALGPENEPADMGGG